MIDQKTLANRAKAKAWYNANAERAIARSKAWIAANREKRRAWESDHRRKLRDAERAARPPKFCEDCQTELTGLQRRYCAACRLEHRSLSRELSRSRLRRAGRSSTLTRGHRLGNMNTSGAARSGSDQTAPTE